MILGLLGGCGLFSPVCIAGHVFTGAVSSVAGSVVDALADAVESAVAQVIATLSTFWVSVGTPDVRSTPAVAWLQGELWWYMAAFAVLAVIVGGARMAWEQKAQPGRELLQGLLTLVAVAGAGVTAIGLATAAADGFSDWIINQSTQGTSFGANMTALLLGSGALSGGALAAILVIVCGMVAVLASLVQIMLMVLRGGMLVLMAGILPTTAAFTSTEMGRQWFRKAVAWTIAFILYKPAASIVYATAFRLAGSSVFGSSGGLTGLLTGLVLMVAALVALPALMRFCVPMVAAVAGGGAGAVMAAGAAAIPTGAMMLSGHYGAGAGAAAGGPTGSATAAGAGGSSGAADGASGAVGGAGATVSGASGAAGANGSSGGAGSAGAGGVSAGGATAAGGAAAAGGVAGVAVAAGQSVVGGARGAVAGAAGEEGPDGSV